MKTCEFCGKPLDDTSSPRTRKFHTLEEDPECYRLRQRKYDNDYYKRNKDILKPKKELGTESLGPHRCENTSEEIIKIRRQMKRLGLITEYTKSISYINASEGI